MEYDKERYKAWALPHPLLLHWVLNPGLAFNEVFLGQRMPKLALIDKTSDQPLMERTFIPCPSCEAMHDGRLWAKGRCFGHWFGYVCPDCGGRIPCLWNLTSLVLLAITFPVWILPVLLWKDRWLAFELRRARAAKEEELVDWGGVPWVKMGALFSGGMWMLLEVVPQLVRLATGGSASWRGVLISIPIWLGGGFLFGLIMKLWMGRKGRTS